MKSFKKLISVFLISTLAFSAVSVNTAMAENYVMISPDTVSAKVIQIIDGDAIKVQLLETNEIALVKIIGVDAQGYDGSVKYLTDKILGAVVTLAKDGNINVTNGCWNYRYVMLGGVNISSELVSKGYAALDTSQANGSLYSYLTDSERAARSSQMELWSYGTNSNNTTVNNGYAVSVSSAGLSGDMININTASAQQLKNRLSGINDTVAQNIVKYRNSNPFNSADEIIFVPGFTKDMYQSNKNIIKVCTNVRTATREELETLGISDDEVDEIINYRTNSILNDIYYVKSKNLMTDKHYESLKSYIDVTDRSTTDATEGSMVVNFNTATVQQITAAGLNSADANVIDRSRTNGYTMKNLMELRFLSGLSLTDEQLYYLEDNLHAMTNVNEAKDSELRSILNGTLVSKFKNSGMLNSLSDVKSAIGSDSYEKIKGTIYCTRNITSYVNLNTATASQIESIAGLSYDQARRIVGSAPMASAEELPFDISDYNDKVTLYTNLNTATEAELKTLNNGVTDALITDIINYRNEQPFGDYEAVRTFFVSKNAGSVYDAIKNYIVVR